MPTCGDCVYLRPVAFDPTSDYPLGQKRPDLVTTPSGLPLDDVTVDAMREGRLRWEDLRATAGALRAQASVAEAAGRVPLADNLARAAELSTIPPETILEIYTALRPHRSTNADLEGWASWLDDAGAPLTADFVREAAAVYAKRGLLGGAHDSI
jgi:propanediol dehydratase small subunit